MPASAEANRSRHRRSSASFPRLAVLLVGGWILSLLAGAVLNSLLSDDMGLAIGIGGLLNLAWIAAVGYEIVNLVRDRRRPPAAELRQEKAPAGDRRPVLAAVSIASPLLVTLFVKLVFFSGPIQGRGESGQIGIAAAGMLCILGLMVGLASGVIAFFIKEPRRLAILGMAANVAVALVLYALLRLALG